MARTDLPEPLRMEVFQALVEAQDRRVPVAESRSEIAARFDLTEKQLAAIESEGIEKEWPPL
jgi:hypothetical protein